MGGLMPRLRQPRTLALLFHVRTEDLVQPAGQRPFLETQMPLSGDRADRLDQRLAVRFHHLRPHALAALAHHPERAACRVRVQPDIPVHWRSPIWKWTL